MSAGLMSPATMRLPARPRPKATPSSADHTTISSGCRVRTCAAIERLDHRQRGQRAQIAVEVAAARHRVDVGSEQDRRRRGVRAGAGGRRCCRPRRCAARVRRLTHEAHDVPASGDVRVGVGDPAHARRRTCRRSAGREGSAPRGGHEASGHRRARRPVHLAIAPSRRRRGQRRMPGRGTSVSRLARASMVTLTAGELVNW